MLLALVLSAVKILLQILLFIVKSALDFIGYKIFPPKLTLEAVSRVIYSERSDFEWVPSEDISERIMIPTVHELNLKFGDTPEGILFLHHEPFFSSPITNSDYGRYALMVFHADQDLNPSCPYGWKRLVLTRQYTCSTMEIVTDFHLGLQELYKDREIKEVSREQYYWVNRFNKELYELYCHRYNFIREEE